MATPLRLIPPPIAEGWGGGLLRSLRDRTAVSRLSESGPVTHPLTRPGPECIRPHRRLGRGRQLPDGARGAGGRPGGGHRLGARRRGHGPHPLPLREQGTRAPRLIAPAGLAARKPDGASWGAAAAFPVLALTAGQVLGEALHIHAGEQLLVHGAAGLTGGLLVALAVLRGAQVIATAGPASQQRVAALGRARSSTTTTTTGPARSAR